MRQLSKTFQLNDYLLENPSHLVNNVNVGLPVVTGKCMIQKIKRRVGGLLCTTLLVLGPVSQAQVLDLGTVLNGSPPDSTTPWLTATFTTIFPGKVTLTLASHLTVDTEFIGEIGLNLRPGLSPAALIFGHIASPSDPAYSTIIQPVAQDTLALSGGGSQGAGFDFTIDWPNGNKLERFDGDDVVSITITGPSDLVAQDFLYYNTVGGQPGSALLAAHIQGIAAPGGGTTSSSIIQAIPEPTTATLLIAGLALLALRSRTRGRLIIEN